MSASAMKGMRLTVCVGEFISLNLHVRLLFVCVRLCQTEEALMCNRIFKAWRKFLIGTPAMLDNFRSRFSLREKRVGASQAICKVVVTRACPALKNRPAC